MDVMSGSAESDEVGDDEFDEMIFPFFFFLFIFNFSFMSDGKVVDVAIFDDNDESDLDDEDDEAFELKVVPIIIWIPHASQKLLIVQLSNYLN